ncbi:MAG: molybdopterin-dependent oxidoreductase [Desulfohalobiaceae bacterium]|nr:molybdopterin-dependent oxidoreductase [Desulfohalobiaceae bacterium]
MEERRNFLKTLGTGLAGFAVFFSPLFSVVREGTATAKRVLLPGNTTRESLINKDPATLDTSNLRITPLEEFQTMGQVDHEVHLDTWRFVLEGHVHRKLSLGYAELKSLPAVERNVLLICPGVFSNHGRWKGVSMPHLLEKAGVGHGAKQVILSGPPGQYVKTERFPIEEVLQNKVFLAYEVNGQRLPQKHGFPLRVVAEDHYGFQWVKYVSSLTVNRT